MSVKQSDLGGKVDLSAPFTTNDFPPHSYEQWCHVVDQGLKGKSFDSLSTSTLEGYLNQPVYGPEDQDRLGGIYGLPGQSPFLRGTRALGYNSHPWRINSPICVPDPSRINEIAKYELTHGSSGIEIGISEAADRGLDPDHPEAQSSERQGGASIVSSADFAQAIEGIDPACADIYIDSNDSTFSLAAQYLALIGQRGVPFSELRGGFCADPLGGLLFRGILAAPLEQRYQEMAAMACWCHEYAPGLRSIRVSAVPFHNAGGNAVQEVGFAIATGAEYLRALLMQGVSVDQAASQISFSFALGTRFFTEVAKLRAARVLWDQVAGAFGCGPAARAMEIHTQTSCWNMSKLDPWANILRATVEAFAALAGGTDSLTIMPFDAFNGVPDALSRRLSRNTQLILRDESFLAKVVDPAGGSWYVEHLSNALGREAWRFFQQVESMGGMAKAMRQGYPQQEITRVALKRSGCIARRREPFIGVSKYANLAEKPLVREQMDWDQVHARGLARLRSARASAKQDLLQQGLQRLRLVEGSGAERMTIAIEAASAGATVGDLSGALRLGDPTEAVVALGRHRGVKSFEKLRWAADAFREKTGGRPRIYLLLWGPVTAHRSCAEFATEFLEAGGFEVIRGTPTTNTEQAASEILKDPATVVVLCAKQEQYPELVTELSPKLSPRIILVAGPPPADSMVAWARKVEVFIHSRSDALSVLTNLQRNMEVVS